MNITEELKNRLKFIGNCSINDEVFKKLLENNFAKLIEKSEIHSFSSFNNSKPDLIKEVYAILLTISAEFGRNNMNKDDVKAFLVDNNFSSNRAALFAELYDKNKRPLQVILGNIGSHLPHITDVEWKIDYIFKASNLDQFEGPIFRIALVTSKYNEVSKTTETERIHFSCTSQEMQDLVYKLKDAVRHAKRLITE